VGLNPASFGQTVSISAAVQAPNNATATGTVTFFNGTTSLGTATLANNSAQINVSTLAVGSYSLTGKYSGDANFAASSSISTTETINQATPITVVSSNSSSVTFGQTVTFTASVAAPYSGSPTGSVTFFDGPASLGSVTLSNNVPQISLSTLSIGTHSITVKYAGDTNFVSATSAPIVESVNQGVSATTIVPSVNPSVVGQPVACTAMIQTPAGTIATGSVTFLDGTITVGTVSVSGNAAQIVLADLAPGSHSISAKYSGDANFTGSSSPSVVETVNQATTATTITSNLNPSFYGQGVTFTANVQTATGGSATGTVAFFDGSAQIGSAGLSGNAAQLATTALVAGSHSITARYSGDPNFTGSASPSLTQTVNPIVSAALSLQVFADQGSPKSTVKSPAFSTSAANELLLAFISSDASGSGTNVKVNGVSGGGLTWVLVLRTNTQKGTAEIWRAFATSTLNNATVTATLSQNVSSSMTVMSFTGADSSGTNGSGAIGAIQSANASSGAPGAQLVTTRNGSLVIGVGDDFDNAISRTLGPGQILVHQYFSPVGDTYWVQMRNAPTILSGTSVVINDTAPTSDRYNLAICEILAAP